jgi:hypothetical protein
MRAPRRFWFGLFLLGATLTACAGGRGSSGFDISENAAIRRAIDTQQCVDHQGLTICPADQAETPVTTASPTPTVTPYTPTAATPGPTIAMSPTPALSMSPTPTPTPTPPRVDTGLGDQTSVTCVQTARGGPCAVAFRFSTEGFPPAATFSVAARAVAPLGVWELAPAPVASSVAAADSYETTVLLGGPEAPAQTQFAVLVFLDPAQSLPIEFHELGDTGADYAFVTPTLSVEVEQVSPLVQSN